MVLSEPSENDIELDIEGMKILVEENMADIFTGFTIDYVDSFFRKGFVVSPIR